MEKICIFILIGIISSLLVHGKPYDNEKVEVKEFQNEIKIERGTKLNF